MENHHPMLNPAQKDPEIQPSVDFVAELAIGPTKDLGQVLFASGYQRSTADAQENPEPKAAKQIRSFSLRRPCSHA